MGGSENFDPNKSFEGTLERKKKKSGFKEWDKRTGAAVYHMTENINKKGQSVIRSVSLTRSRGPSPEPTNYMETDDRSEIDPNMTYDEIPTKENVDTNES